MIGAILSNNARCRFQDGAGCPESELNKMTVEKLGFNINDWVVDTIEVLERIKGQIADLQGRISAIEKAAAPITDQAICRRVRTRDDWRRYYSAMDFCCGEWPPF